MFMVVDDHAIEPFALIDLNEIQRLGTATGFDVLVDLHWRDSAPERFELREGELKTIPGAGAAAAAVDRAAALRQFLADALRDRPARHYLLMLWGHAYGFGFGRRAPERIAIPELAQILSEFAVQREGARLEILACNTCRVGKVETVYELHNVVRYLVASQIGVPHRGWPLREVLSDLVASPWIAPPDLARLMVTRYCDWYRNQTVTMTMLDLDQSGRLLALLKVLATRLRTAIEESDHELSRVHEAFVLAANDQEETEPVVDLYRLCTTLHDLTGDPQVRAATAEVLEALAAPTFIAKHDGLGPGADHLHGVGLYVPHVTLDANLPVHKTLGLEHSLMWRAVVEHLRATQKHTAVLAAIDTLEAETLSRCRRAEIVAESQH